MSANLPSRGNRRQGPGGREVQQAAAPGAAHRPAARTGGDEQRASQQRASEQRASQRPAAGAAGTRGEPGTDDAGGGPSDADRRRLRTQRALRSPRAVRQAILLRELLGPPVALRRHREDPPSLSD